MAHPPLQTHTHFCRHDSSRSPIKSQSPDVSFTHNSKESRRSRTKSRSPDSSSRQSKILEDLGRADIFGPLSGDPHDRPMATVGISLGNTHTHIHKHTHICLCYGVWAWKFQEIHFMNASFGKAICKISYTHTPHTHQTHSRMCVCAYTFTDVCVCKCVGVEQNWQGWWYVSRLAPASTADDCGRIQVFDELLNIDCIAVVPRYHCGYHCDPILVQDWNMIFHGWYFLSTEDMLLIFYLINILFMTCPRMTLEEIERHLQVCVVCVCVCVCECVWYLCVCMPMHIVVLVNMKLTGGKRILLMYEQGTLGSVIMLAFRRPSHKVCLRVSTSVQ